METTGHKLTKASIGFYDFSKIQGKYLGLLAKILNGSHVTHTGLILETNDKEYHFVICSAKQEWDGRIVPVSKLYNLETLQGLGAILIGRTEMWITEDMSLEDAVTVAASYTDSNAWDMVFHYFIGRFIGLTRPRNCTTHVCSFFNIEDCFIPAELYRRFNDNNLIVRPSESR